MNFRNMESYKHVGLGKIENWGTAIFKEHHWTKCRMFLEWKTESFGSNKTILFLGTQAKF